MSSSYDRYVYNATLKALMDDRTGTIRRILAKALKLHEKNRNNSNWLGFEWYEVPPAAPQTLNQLVRDEIMVISYKSNRATAYKLADVEAVRKALEDFDRMQEIEESDEIPENLFDIIVGHDDVKEILWRSLKSERPVHILLYGPVASAKSLFLLCLSRLPRSEFILGSSLTKAGLIDLLFTREPRYLIIDEIEKVDDPENLTALLSLMQSGIVSVTKYRRRYVKQFTTWVFASANRISKLPPELLSRFLPIKFREYDEKEFVKVAVHVLTKMENIPYEVANYIAVKVMRVLKSRDVRDCVKVARLISRSGSVNKMKSEVDRVVKILREHS